MKILKLFGMIMFILGTGIMINCLDFSSSSEIIFSLAAITTTIGGILWGNIEAREK